MSGSQSSCIDTRRVHSYNHSQSLTFWQPNVKTRRIRFFLVYQAIGKYGISDCCETDRLFCSVVILVSPTVSSFKYGNDSLIYLKLIDRLPQIACSIQWSLRIMNTVYLGVIAIVSWFPCTSPDLWQRYKNRVFPCYVIICERQFRRSFIYFIIHQYWNYYHNPHTYPL